MEFKKGDKVVVCLSGAGHTTREDAIVAKATKKEVWLDNGSGNSESGPFNPVSGEYAGGAVPGFRMYIQAARQ